MLRLFADSSEAQQILGFTPTVSLIDGLEQLHQWYLQRGRSAADLLAEERVHNWKQEQVV